MTETPMYECRYDVYVRPRWGTIVTTVTSGTHDARASVSFCVVCLECSVADCESVVAPAGSVGSLRLSGAVNHGGFLLQITKS